ncbi:MAG: FAD-dependent monooxygenase [Pseudomonadota bacterium]|uniref:FAD-dependent monooxygenase n=1 Tax=Roseovarius TaxID=74030 RepID=UPI0022A80757|nr:FAD-dependent monooxygenase [Roseovarius sp. EGI FJ00037]MCZ0810867.1 FAD-dependent monooxygenase [Roseovarius sp. EGI FJ00037]
MSLSGMNILVIGAGIGGLAAARALALRGADVTVMEQAPEITEVGAGLQISPNGFVVLKALGLGDAIKARSIGAGAVCLNDYSGRRVVRLDLARHGLSDYFFVHRADLIDILAEGARAAGVRLRLLQKVASVTPDTRPRVDLANGASLSADLVIGADGLHSKAREALNGRVAPFFTRQVAWRAVIAEDGSQPAEARVYMGPHRHLVSYPLRDGRMRNIVAVQERAAWAAESWSQEDDPLAMQAAFGDFCPEARELLARVERVNLWGLFRHPVAASWHGGGVAIMGDAAHPTLPFMAQGACMALEDAWVLADTLAGQGGAAEGRLAAYQARRRNRTRRIVEAANGNAWKYHLSFKPLRWAAHSAMRLGGTLAPERMLRQFEWIHGHDVTADARA